ncbi:hypothetical protein GYH30_004482 [Glycine max]|uniref:Uncharacterized protein n=1 Tax=Glycine max TaxID=3847 RepID=A0A0R0KYM3_SOYBN|nr:hypothetical protein GYH30_004482 [Glycine max]
MKQPHHQRGREHDIYDRDDDEAATNGITTTGGDDGGTYDDSWHDGTYLSFSFLLFYSHAQNPNRFPCTQNPTYSVLELDSWWKIINLIFNGEGRATNNFLYFFMVSP